LPILKMDGPVSVGGDFPLVRHKSDGNAPLRVESLEDVHNVMAGGGVQSACRLISQDQRGVGHQAAGNGHPLLLAPRKLSGPVRYPVAQPQVGKGLKRQPPPVGYPAIEQGQLHLLHRWQAAKEVEALEHEADLVIADHRQPLLIEGADHHAIELVDT